MTDERRPDDERVERPKIKVTDRRVMHRDEEAASAPAEAAAPSADPDPTEGVEAGLRDELEQARREGR